jgi:hypothetical protein
MSMQQENDPNEPPGPEKGRREELTLKRVQRGVEYALLTVLHTFFVVSFHQFLLWWMAMALAATMFGLNFQLTMLRERRRTAAPRNRARLLGDTFESVLFLVFIVALTLAGALKGWAQMSDPEYLGYVAATLAGLFLAGLAGELYWQGRHLGHLDGEHRANYIRNLPRTIILPFIR